MLKPIHRDVGLAMLCPILLLLTQAAAQPLAIDASQHFPIYPSGSPSTRPADRPERDDGTGRFYVVSEPQLYVWPAKPGTSLGPAIIACPGGSYDHITMEAEGQRIAHWLNPMGITVFGLKYRTRPPSADVAADALADGQRAMRLVRSRAKEWNLDPNKIGMLGYSAGSNLVLNVASHFDLGKAHGEDAIDLVNCRPDFVVLLSTWPNRQTLEAFPLRPDSPPTFIAIAKDDRTAPPPFTYEIKAKLDELKVPVTLYEAETGGHGAFHLDEPRANTGWKEPFLGWLGERGVLPRK